MRLCFAAVLLFASLTLGPAPRAAEQIVVTQYTIGANGMPYAIGMEKGFFQQEGAEIADVLSSAGGGTTVRIMLGGNLPYGEIDLAGTVAAIQQGADLKIVSDNVLTVAEFIWASKKGSAIRTVADLKGKKIGFTNPRSTSQALGVLLLETLGMQPGDAELTRVGRTSMSFHVSAWRRARTGDDVSKVTDAMFTFVALDAEGRPRVIPD